MENISFRVHNSEEPSKIVNLDDLSDDELSEEQARKVFGLDKKGQIDRSDIPDLKKSFVELTGDWVAKDEAGINNFAIIDAAHRKLKSVALKSEPDI